MALYFDSVLDCPSGAATTCIEWQQQFSLVAVGSSLTEGNGGSVSLFSKKGIIEHSGPVLQKNVNPTALCWHPSRKILAVGWENGDIFIWNDQEKETHNVPQLHTASITSIKWTSKGNRIGSCDKEGIFAAWRCDIRGRVQHDPLFRIDLCSPIKDCVCKPKNAASNVLDLSNIADLAKAAVSGDETALDLLANFNSTDGRLKVTRSNRESQSFYIGLDNGMVHYIDENGTKSDCFELDSSVLQLLYCPEKDYLVALSSSLQVIQGRVLDDGQVEQMQQAKFSGVDGSARITWAGPELLAAATSDSSLRMWDLSTGNNYALVLKDVHGFSSNECITSVASGKTKRILAAITDENRLAVWKAITDGTDLKNPEDRWILQPAIRRNLPCSIITWCEDAAVLAAGGAEGASLLTEQKSKYALCYSMAAIQSGPRQVTVNYIGEKGRHAAARAGAMQMLPQPFMENEKHSTFIQLVFDSDIAYNGMDVASNHVAIWNGQDVSIYKLEEQKETRIGHFSCTSTVNALHDEGIFTVEKPKSSKDLPKIQVQNYQGTVKQLLPLKENEGKPVVMDVNSNYMVFGTNEGYFRVYDLTRRDAKPMGNSIKLSERIPEFGSITSLSCNHKGSHVAIICSKDNGIPDTRLFVYDVEADQLRSFDFLTGTNDLDEVIADSGPKSDIEMCRAEAALEVAGRCPISVCWDAIEHKLLCCEAQITPAAIKELHEENDRRKASNFGAISAFSPISIPDVMVVSLFATAEQGLMLQDSYEKSERFENLIGSKAPHHFFSHVLTSDEAEEEAHDSNSVTKQSSNIARKVMRDFVGLENTDEAAQSAMLNFSYYLTVGDMDEAFKSIKLIKGFAVWENMARMCVKTRRLDVAKVCLANMGHARGARALREIEKEPERDARVARLAVELGMNEEAERLYKNCERYDLLNQFYQAAGHWDKAMEIASQLDRINFRTTFYNYAKHLEASGDIANAIPNYEKSGNHYFEVPRMLFDDTQMLETYIMNTNDRKLRKWWAQYMESTGEMEAAIKFYKQAADPLSLVRVYCYCGNVNEAAEIANETGDRAACYHLARQFENSDDFKQAIHFFSRAQAYGNAIRICKENGFEDQLMNLALISTPNDMVDAAKYYEDRPDTVDKAVMLYHKAGYFSEALELAFQSQQYGALEVIAQELDDRTDPALLEKCANFYKEHDQADRAVPMLVAAKKFEEAIHICHDKNVILNENLVEKLSIPPDFMEKQKRDRLLVMLGDCLMRQAQYHLACQKYTQGGDKDQAMRALLKSGDTEKIVFFAGVSRTRTIYVMAANYLQSLDWRKDPEIMKNIISFYTKGRALDSLAGFYGACAQVEIDEYQNYDKALGALSEAYKCLAKAKMDNQHQQEIKLAELKSRIELVKKFIQARKLFESNPEEGIKQCHNLLLETDLETAVRYGDVYGLLIEYYAARENYDKAYHYMQELRGRMTSVSLSYFINVSTIEAVHRALGVPMSRLNLANGDGKKEEESDEEVAEQVFDR